MIRDYRESDLEEYMAVWDAASAQAHPFLTDEFVADLRDKVANVYLPVTENWVWEADGHVVGFIALMGNEIGGLFVDPNHSRAGIGKALVDHARTQRDTLEVEVFTENPIGRAFYKKYGFTEIAQSVHEETGNGVVRLRLDH